MRRLAMLSRSLDVSPMRSNGPCSRPSGASTVATSPANLCSNYCPAEARGSLSDRGLTPESSTLATAGSQHYTSSLTITPAPSTPTAVQPPASEASSEISSRWELDPSHYSTRYDSEVSTAATAA